MEDLLREFIEGVLADDVEVKLVAFGREELLRASRDLVGMLDLTLDLAHSRSNEIAISFLSFRETIMLDSLAHHDSPSHGVVRLGSHWLEDGLSLGMIGHLFHHAVLVNLLFAILDALQQVALSWIQSLGDCSSWFFSPATVSSEWIDELV